MALDEHGHAQVEGKGKPIEWLVKMRRLPSAHMLDARIRAGDVREQDLWTLVHCLIDFYRESPPAGLDGPQYRAAFVDAIEANHRELVAVDHRLPQDSVRTLHAAQINFLHDCAPMFDARAAAGRIVEGHGDLRPEHICLNARPLIIDCLEFNRDFRLVDPADELASLAMECERLGADFAGATIFSAYTQISGDFPPAALLAFYRAYRACLRARLAIWHTRELDPGQWSTWQDRACAYLQIAQNHLAGMAGGLTP